MLLSAQSISLERKTQLAALREEAQCTGQTCSQYETETAGLIQTALKTLQGGSPSALPPRTSSSFACLSPPSPLSPSSIPSSTSSQSQSQSPFPLLPLMQRAGMELELELELELEQDSTPTVTPTPSSISILDASMPSSLAISDTSVLSSLTTSDYSIEPALAISDRSFTLATQSIAPLMPLARIPSEALIMPPPTASRPSSFLETLPLSEGSERHRRGSKFSSQDYTQRTGQTRGVLEASAAADTVRTAFCSRDRDSSQPNPNLNPTTPPPSSSDLSYTGSDGNVSCADAHLPLPLPLFLQLSIEAQQSDMLLEGTAEEGEIEPRMTERSLFGDDKGIKEDAEEEEEEEEEEGADDGCASEEGDLFEGDQGYGLSYVVGHNSR
jgi:hypothetical protein